MSLECTEKKLPHTVLTTCPFHRFSSYLNPPQKKKAHVPVTYGGCRAQGFLLGHARRMASLLQTFKSRRQGLCSSSPSVGYRSIEAPERCIDSAECLGEIRFVSLITGSFLLLRLLEMNRQWYFCSEEQIPFHKGKVFVSLRNYQEIICATARRDSLIKKTES